MKPLIQFVVVVGIIAGLAYATRSVRHQRARAIALPVIWELGGKVGSISAPFGGTEYYISFTGRSLTRDNIDRLVVLNGLARNWNYVSLSLSDVVISPEDREYMRQKLPDVHILPAESDTRAKPAA